MMPGRFHDDLLVGHAVDGEARRLELRIRSCRDGKLTTVRFHGLQGYALRHDALVNIIFELTEVDPAEVIASDADEIAEMFRSGGALGPWAEDLATAGERLAAAGVRGFLLDASFGMSGWVLAERAELRPGEPGGG